MVFLSDISQSIQLSFPVNESEYLEDKQNYHTRFRLNGFLFVIYIRYLADVDMLHFLTCSSQENYEQRDQR